MTGIALPDVIRRTGATYRQLDYWTRRGYLQPVPGNTSGLPRAWPRIEVQVAAKMVALIEAGLTAEAAADVARCSVTEHTDRVRISGEIVVEFSVDVDLLP